MKRFLKKNWFLLLLGIFVLINAVLVTYNFVILKQRKSEYQKFMDERKSSEIRQPIQNIHPDFYNSPCPEVSSYSISGEKINLRDLTGKVIIIRFSRFYRQDLPNLIYLQHLADKYRDQGVFLIFINSIGKYDEEGVSKIVKLHFPII